LMINDKVWPAMSRAFESAEGDLADRMLVALEAAQAAGGDIRGKQSAALVVVSGKPTGKPWEDRRYDLRVDDHSEPVAELRRLVKLQRAYNLMNDGDLAVERKDHEGALRAYAGAEALLPGNAEMIFWHAVALVAPRRSLVTEVSIRSLEADHAWTSAPPITNQSFACNMHQVRCRWNIAKDGPRVKWRKTGRDLPSYLLECQE
jgi:hypothetical protein